MLSIAAGREHFPLASIAGKDEATEEEADVRGKTLRWGKASKGCYLALGAALTLVLACLMVLFTVLHHGPTADVVGEERMLHHGPTVDAVEEERKAEQSVERLGALYAPRMAQAKAEANVTSTSLPLPGEWIPRLQRMIDLGRGDPCAAEALAYMGWKFGVGSRFKKLANEFWVAIHLNLSLALCKGEGVEKIWMPHFSNHARIGICEAKRCLDVEFQRNKSQALWYQGQDFLITLKQTHPTYVNAFWHQAFDFFYRLNDETRKAILGVLHQLELFKDVAADGMHGWPSYLGVHIRHGDKFKEVPLLNFTVYAKRIRALLVHHGLETVYVASDDPLSCGSIRQLLGQGIKVVEQPRLALEAYGWGEAYKADSALMALFTDLEALRRSTVFLGTASSNVGRAVHYLRGNLDTDVTLDQGW